MRKIFLDELPRRKEGIDWYGSIGKRVKFIYDGIQGEVEIVAYDSDKGILSLKYKNKIHEKIYLSSFKQCKIARVIGLRSTKHVYEVGEVVNDIRLLEQIRMPKYNSSKIEKGYVYICEKESCKHQDAILETEVTRGTGCTVCGHNLLDPLINSLGVLRPDLISLLVNPEDAYSCMKTANRDLECKCPDCGYIKIVTASNLSHRGFCCPKCADGISYPNKFIFNVLTQLDVEFQTEYPPKWAKDETGSQRKYDSYILAKNLIIEMDGDIGHGGYVMEGTALTSEETLEIDSWKDEVAKLHGVDVIRIDCRYKDADRYQYVMNSIMQSELARIFPLEKVDFKKCHEFALSSRVKEACKLWECKRFDSTAQLAKYMKLSSSTIRKYLKQGAELGWCDYDAQVEQLKWAGINGKRKRPEITSENASYMTQNICRLWNNGVFSSEEISKQIGISSRNVLRHLLLGASIGICDYSTEKARQNARERANETMRSRSKKVRVVGFDYIFDSISDLVQKSIEIFGVQFLDSKVSSVCNGKRKTHKRFRFEYVE